MAADAKWCRSLSDWIGTYDDWLRRADPQDMTDLSVFLDFRLVWGDAALVGALRRHVHATLPEQRGVQYLLARHALAFRPPMRLPGNIYLGGAAESSGRFDLKDARGERRPCRVRLSVFSTSPLTEPELILLSAIDLSRDCT